VPAALPLCSHRPPCPGCPRYGEAGIAAEALDDLEQLVAEAGGPPFEVVEGAQLGFRQRARLAVRGRAASPKIGIFQAGSHRIVDIPDCRVHHPLVNRVAAALKRAVRATGVSPYAERPHRGVLRYLQIAVERRSQRAQVVLVGNGTSPEPLAATCDALAAELGASLHSLWWNGNPDRGNHILGRRWQRLRGDEALRERIGGADVFFPPGAFGQSNLDLADAVVERVAGWIPDGARVAEYHAGCGAVGLGLLRSCSSVAMNELSEHGRRGLELGVAARPAAEGERARIEAGAAGERLDLLRDADAVVVDPPRKGLEEALLAGLVAARPGTLAYVSCDRTSFARDARRLLGDGGFRLRALTAYGLFPYTHHVEIAAHFEP
jgi:tRNA/tmRNA/rRNA uracil-C5-methylase (TrmA/RlmC/RlmD family)